MVMTRSSLGKKNAHISVRPTTSKSKDPSYVNISSSSEESTHQGPQNFEEEFETSPPKSPMKTEESPKSTEPEKENLWETQQPKPQEVPWPSLPHQICAVKWGAETESDRELDDGKAWTSDEEHDKEEEKEFEKESDPALRLEKKVDALRTLMKRRFRKVAKRMEDDYFYLHNQMSGGVNEINSQLTGLERTVFRTTREINQLSDLVVRKLN